MEKKMELKESKTGHLLSIVESNGKRHGRTNAPRLKEDKSGIRKEIRKEFALDSLATVEFVARWKIDINELLKFLHRKRTLSIWRNGVSSHGYSADVESILEYLVFNPPSKFGDRVDLVLGNKDEMVIVSETIIK